MSEYRHFFAYIYEYRNEKKENNAGYVKVDSRNGDCRMQIRMQFPDLRTGKVKIYGFVRIREWILGISIGEGQMKNGSCQFRIGTRTEQIGGSGYGLAELKGIWLKGEDRDYISVWDEEPVSAERFVLEVPAEEEPVQEVPTEEESVQKIPAAEVSVEENLSGEGEQPEKKETGLALRWQQFLFHYLHMDPFSDEEVEECVRIAPKDIFFLGKWEWNYGKNPFVVRGFARYGHLLLGHCKDGRFFLGVPGMNYDSQDRHLAQMYGFPEFKEGINADAVTAAEESEGRFGYWYHFIRE